MRLEKRQLFALEQALVVVALLFYTGGLSTVLITIGFPHITHTLIRYGILIPGFVIFFQQPRSFIAALRQGKWLWLLLGWISLSVAWSSLPTVTFENLRSAVFPMAIFSLYFSVRFSLKQQFKLIVLALSIATFVSFFVSLTMPSVGRHTDLAHYGKWKGIYVHKNTFGAYTALNLFGFLLNTLYSQKPGIKKWLPPMICGLLALLSGSKTALFLSGMMTLIILFYRRLKWRGKRTVFFLMVLGIILILGQFVLAQIWEPFLTAIGRDPTLSGRTLVWEYLREKIRERPLLGYGHGIFWLVPDYFAKVWDIAGDIPSHAHNGFYELALSGGLTAVFLFFVGWGIAFIKSLKLAYRATQVEYLWPFAFLVFEILQNLYESHLLRGESLFWVLYGTILCSIDKWQFQKDRESLVKSHDFCQSPSVVGKSETDWTLPG